MVDRYVIIDGDILLYKALFASEHEHDFGDGEVHLESNLDQALASVNAKVADLVELSNADPIFAMSDAENWRKAIYAPYKAPRKSHRKPIGLSKLKAAMNASDIPCVTRPTLEADDVLGILGSGDQIIKGRKLMVSIDKDLLQIPGAHFNPDNPEDGVTKVKPPEGATFHLFQTLTGDTVDNYPGCPGVGPKAAMSAADERGRLTWETVVGMFEKKELTETDALVQAQVARICTADDYDFKKRKVIPWTP